MANSNSSAFQALEEKRSKQRRKKTRNIIIALVIIVLLSLVGAYLLISKMKSNDKAQQNNSAEVYRADFSKTITTNGTIQALANQSVSALANGEVTSVKVEAGTEVKPGDVLFTYKSEELEKGISDAEKAVIEAQNGLKQAKSGVSQAINAYNRAVDQYNAELDAAAQAQSEAQRQQAIARANQIAQEQQAAAAAQEQALRANAINTLINNYQQEKNQKQLFDKLAAAGKAQKGMSFAEAKKILDQRKSEGADVSWVQTELDKAKIKPGGGTYADTEVISSLDQHWLNMMVYKSQLKSMGIDPDNPAAAMDGGSGATVPEGPGAPDNQGGPAAAANQILPFDKVGQSAAIEQAEFGVVSAKLAVNSAQENLKLAKERYNNGVVEAKISGQVIALNIEVGTKLEALAQSGKPAIQIADVSAMKAQININEMDILRVKKDMEAVMSFNAINDYETKGKVETIASSPASGQAGADLGGFAGPGGGSSSSLVTYPVGILLENPDPRIKVGMTTQVTLMLEEIKDALQIPLDAVNSDGDKDYINVVTLDSSGLIVDRKRIYIEVLSSNESVSVIKDDGQVKEGDQVEVFSGEESFDGPGAYQG